MSYCAHTPEEVQEMLSAVGKKSLSELFDSVPRELIEKTPGLAAPALPEYDVISTIKQYAAENKPLSAYNSFLGAGCYHGYIPAAVNHLVSKPEFYTAYTPYQPEISQGILQSIYEYQSFICLLTGMDVTSASLYDGASSVAEAVLMGQRIKGGRKVLIAGSLHPHYRTVADSYLAPLNINVNEVPWNDEGRVDLNTLGKKLSASHSSLVVQTPNFFGVMEDIPAIGDICKEKGVPLIVAVANPLALGLFRLPSEKIDIVCGNGGPLGGTPYWGGDTFGFIAAKERFMRNLPGRIVGKTVDKNNTTCYVLTLQAREQHIKREHATSNICSNQALNALKAAVYLGTIGETGFKKLALANFYNAQYLRQSIEKNLSPDKIAVRFSECIFNEFVIELKTMSVGSLYKKCKKNGIIPGLALKPYYKKLKNALLVCTSEIKTRNEMDAYVENLKKSL